MENVPAWVIKAAALLLGLLLAVALWPLLARAFGKLSRRGDRD